MITTLAKETYKSTTTYCRRSVHQTLLRYLRGNGCNPWTWLLAWRVPFQKEEEINNGRNAEADA